MRKLLCLLIFVPSLLWGQSQPFTAPAPKPEFAEVQAASLYVPMKDGIRIALDVLLPAGLPAGRRIPALLKISRFGRAPQNGAVSMEDRFWVQQGFARVLMDERGTGASSGSSQYGPAEISDLREVVDWVVKQPWSNGRVGAIGVSFEGTAAELLAATNHPAVRAVAPWFSDFNYYTDLVRPGGVYNEWLMKNFEPFMRQMNSGADAKRVETDTDGALLKQAIADHRGNPDIYRATQGAEFIDDPLPGVSRSLLDMSIPGAREQFERSRVPMMILVSWFDAGTVQGTLQRFHDFSNAQEIFIGAWSHGAAFNANPFSPAVSPVTPSMEQQWLQALSFFNHYLKETPPSPNPVHLIHYYTVGENHWHSTTVWPPPGMHRLIYYLDADRTLSPRKAGTSLKVEIPVTSTGEQNRWHTQFGGQPVVYTGALKEMETLPSFISEPLGTPLEITGKVVLRLRLACSQNDPSVFAYLVALNPQGKTVYLTEGQLRLIHRKLNPSEQTLHTYARRDAEPLAPDKPTEADLTLLPISVLLPKGYRLQLLLAGGDAAVFSTSGEYQATIFASSRIELPAKERPDWTPASSGGGSGH